MAQAWADKARDKYDMDCTYEVGALQDQLCFARAGIQGTLDVGPDAFDFHAKLGFLISAFKERIESELERQLDTMLASPADLQTPVGTQPAATDDGVAAAQDLAPAARAGVSVKEAVKEASKEPRNARATGGQKQP